MELSWSVTQSAQQLDDSLLLASPGINQSCKSSPASGCCSCDTENGVFANSYELPSKNQFVSTEQRQNCHLTTAAVNSGSVITTLLSQNTLFVLLRQLFSSFFLVFYPKQVTKANLLTLLQIDIAVLNTVWSIHLYYFVL